MAAGGPFPPSLPLCSGLVRRGRGAERGRGAIGAGPGGGGARGPRSPLRCGRRQLRASAGPGARLQAPARAGPARTRRPREPPPRADYMSRRAPRAPAASGPASHRPLGLVVGPRDSASPARSVRGVAPLPARGAALRRWRRAAFLDSSAGGARAAPAGRGSGSGQAPGGTGQLTAASAGPGRAASPSQVSPGGSRIPGPVLWGPPAPAGPPPARVALGTAPPPRPFTCSGPARPGGAAARGTWGGPGGHEPVAGSAQRGPGLGFPGALVWGAGARASVSRPDPGTSRGPWLLWSCPCPSGRAGLGAVPATPRPGHQLHMAAAEQ